MINTNKLWDICLESIQEELSKANFNTWFSNTYIQKENSGTIFLAVPSEFVRDWLSNKYHRLIISHINKNFPSVRAVEYVISKGKQKIKEDEHKDYISDSNKLPLENHYINRENNLNPRYVFKSFIVGPFNELAFAASQAIIKKPGVSYNPLFIYGPTGTGKTHLLQAAGNAIHKNFPKLRIMYCTLEKFSIDYVTSVQKNKPNIFKDKYRNYDVLIMDDIQFISGKEKTQEELFHLFNSLYEMNKQIIFSSDKHPNYIPGLEERLKSRFSAGMIVDVNEPETESKIAIIRTKLEDSDITLQEDVIEYLAKSLEGSIRELEGSLNAVLCQTQLKKRDLSVSEVKSLIKNNIRPAKNISIEEIVRTVSDFYNIESKLIYEKTRRKEIVRARQVIMYILREDFNISYPHIGQKLGGKDHTTVMHSCSKIKNASVKDVVLNQEVEQLRALFK
ncbi:MAG: chromosomal replication initiator protein [Flavobacteriaceae bacterium]|jgi:chromosomal replication initiator protein